MYGRMSYRNPKGTNQMLFTNRTESSNPGLVRRTRYAGLTRARRRTYATNADRNELVACIFLGAAIVGIAGGAIAALLF